MNISYSTYKTSPRRLQVASGEAIAVEARAGTEVRGLDGMAWVTQDGDALDYILPAGVRFTAERAGRVVVTAVDRAAQVVVSWHAPEGGTSIFRSRLSVDYERVAELKRAARTARAREIARLLAYAWDSVTSAFRRLARG